MAKRNKEVQIKGQSAFCLMLARRLHDSVAREEFDKTTNTLFYGTRYQKDIVRLRLELRVLAELLDPDWSYEE